VNRIAWLTEIGHSRVLEIVYDPIDIVALNLARNFVTASALDEHVDHRVNAIAHEVSRQAAAEWRRLLRWVNDVSNKSSGPAR
jgi:hypothetical protein